MKITPDLIERYHSGTCSDEERKAVELWLANTDVEESTLSEQRLEKMKSNIWQSLSAKRNEKRPASIPIPLYKRVIRYAAAVFIAFASFGSLYIMTCQSGMLNTDIGFDNTKGSTAKNIATASLNFEILSHSKLHSSKSPCGSTSKISFCGNNRIKNVSDQKVLLHIISDCNSTFAKKQVSLKPGDRCVLYTSLKGKAYIIKNGNQFQVPPADWQRLRSLSLT